MLFKFVAILIDLIFSPRWVVFIPQYGERSQLGLKVRCFIFAMDEKGKRNTVYRAWRARYDIVNANSLIKWNEN